MDKAAVRDRRKLFVATPAVAAAVVAAGAVAAAGAAAPAADAAVAAVAAGAAAPAADAAVALVDVAVWRPRDHLARRARVVLGRPVKAGPAAAGAERAFGQAKQAQVAELWSPSAVLREAMPARWQRREQSRVHAPADPMAPPESKSSSVRPAR